MKSTKEFKKHIAGKGYFAAISVEVECLREGNGCLSGNKESNYWPAVQAAFAYCSEIVLRRSGQAIAVNVVELRTMIVDSSFMVVMYVAMVAIFEAAGITDHGVRINEDGELVLPK